MKQLQFLLSALSVVLLGTAASQAAFVVDADVGNANFSFGGDTTSASASAPSAAVGTAGVSLFGGNGAASPDNYTFSYTPGTDADNFSPAAGSLLGSTTGFGTETASGIAGGGSGLYNVYYTTPSSTNVNAAGSKFTIIGDGGPLVIDPVDNNDGGTGPDLDPGPAFVGGANNSWFLLGTVQLTAGTSYTVTQEANVNSFVSQRSAAIMWEAVPEPTSLALVGLASIGLLVTRRRRS